MMSIYLNKIRQQKPLIHNMTNFVVANYCANGLLALGASPFMSNNIEEVAEIQCISQALVINIGTITEQTLQAMRIAGIHANKMGIPVVLDPVGVGATTYRKNAVQQLLSEIKFAAIKGNIAELATITGMKWQSKGVDAGIGEGNAITIAQNVAQYHHCIAIISGEIDTISNGTKVVTLHNGTKMFPNITGSGCLLGSVCAAFLAVSSPDDYFQAAIEACSTYAIAGENAAQQLSETQYGNFLTNLLNELASITPKQVKQRGKIYEM